MRSFRAKFLVAFLVAAILPLTLYAVDSYMVSSRALNGLQREELGRDVQAVNAALLSDTADNVAVLHDYATSERVGRAVVRGDDAWLRANVTTYVPENFAVDGVQVLGIFGGALAASGALRDMDFAWLTEVRKAHIGSASWGLERLDNELWIVAAEPVAGAADAGTRAGVLVFLKRIDDATLKDIEQLTGTEVVAYVDNQAVASSWVDDPPPHPLALPAKPQPNVILNEGDWASTLATLYSGSTPLADGQRVVGTLKVSVQRAALAAAHSSIKRSMTLSILAAIAIATGVGLLASTRVGGPLARLAAAAAAISRGETGHRLSWRRSDEFGHVARMFDDMSERVDERIGELSDRIQGLSAELGNLNVFGETLAHTPDVHGELRRLTPMLATMFAGDFVGIYLDEGGSLGLAAQSGALDGSARALEELTRLAMLSGHPLTVADLADDERVSPAAAAEIDGLKSALIVPLARRSGDGAVVVASGEPRDFAKQDVVLLSTIASQIAVALQNAETYAKLEGTYLETVTALAAAMEAKDHYTAEHADMLASMAVAVGRELGLAENEVRQIQYAAVLHDIGKIGIPGHILNKPDRLTDAEFAVMAEHTVIGERIISRIEFLEPIARIIRSAHERWDGRGYPDGIAGEDIPLAARILFVCDAYHAMTSDRPYRKAMRRDEALHELLTHAGTQFDPSVVDAFARIAPVVDQESPAAEVYARARLN